MAASLEPVVEQPMDGELRAQMIGAYRLRRA
jgi:hypothetical protein